MSTFFGKTVLVTGASSGLGAAAVRRFAADGAHVYAASRDLEKLDGLTASCADAPGRVSHGFLDVADPQSCRDAVEAAVKAGGGLDVLVNNAGRHDFKVTTEVTEEGWANDLAVNLSGAFFTSQAAIPHLLERGGNIVNVASTTGVSGQAYSAGYCAAKHGLVGLTRALAVEYIKTPLRVNCICPGGMDTPQAHTIGIPQGIDFDLIVRPAALRGLMTPESVAEVIAFLASDAAVSVNGTVQIIDHGHHTG